MTRLRWQWGAALLRLGAVVTALYALTYFVMLYYAVNHGGLDADWAGNRTPLTVAQVILSVGPLGLITVLLTYEILGPRSRPAMGLALAAWYAVATLRQVAWPGAFNAAAEVGAIALVALIILATGSERAQLAGSAQ
jgi:hypothetical protein